MLFVIAATAATNTVVFNLGDFTTQPVTYKQVRIAPVPSSFPRAEGDQVLGRDPIFYFTTSDGKFTNVMATGDYDVTFTNRFTATTFRITLPSTNTSGLLSAKDLTSAGTNAPGNLSAYSQVASDGRFALRTNAIMSVSTNFVRLTNGIAGGITNLNFRSNVLAYVTNGTVTIDTLGGSGSGEVTTAQLNTASNLLATQRFNGDDYFTNQVGAHLALINTQSNVQWVADNYFTNWVNSLWAADVTFTNVVNALDDDIGNVFTTLSTSLATKMNYATDGVNLTNNIAAASFTNLLNVTNASGTTVTVDWNGPPEFNLPLSGSTTLSFTNVPASGTRARKIHMRLYAAGVAPSVTFQQIAAPQIDWRGITPTVSDSLTNRFLFEFDGTNFLGYSFQEVTNTITGNGATVHSNSPTIYNPTILGQLNSTNLLALSNAIVALIGGGGGGGPYGASVAGFEYFEDFLGAQLGTAVPGFGGLGLYKAIAGSGTLGQTGIPTTNAPGFFSMGTGTTIAGSSFMYNFSANGTDNAIYNLRGVWTNEWRFRLTNRTNNIDSTNNFHIVAGFSDNASAAGPLNDGLHLYYFTNSPFLGFICASNSVMVTNYTTLQPQSNTWYKVRIVATVNASTSTAVCTIDGANTVNFTGGIPTTGARNVALQAGILKKDGTDAAILDIDYCYLGFALETTR